MKCGRLIRVACPALVVLALFAGGCGWPPGYIPSVVRGELAFLAARVPIEAALNDRSLTQEERDKLAFLIRARDYARQTVGLWVGNNFQEFVNLHGEALAWNLSGSRGDALAPYYWRIPIVGRLPYLGFFSLDRAMAESDRLHSKGYDTFIYEVDTYALPYLPDPVSSRMLRRSYGNLADVVMHELTHSTISSLDDVTFTESLAMFVGRTAGLEFLEVDFGPGDPIIAETQEEYEDADRYNAFLAELVDELEELYGSDLSSAEKIAARQPIFDAAMERFTNEVLPLMNNPDVFEEFADYPINNAYLLVNVRYNSDLDLFAAIHAMTGENWEESLEIFAAAADTSRPFQYLEDVLAAGP